MDGGVFNVLAPDIQKSLHISDAVLGAIGGATGVLFVLGAIPMSSLSDRMSRKQLVAITMTIWSVIIMLDRRGAERAADVPRPAGSRAGPVGLAAGERSPARSTPIRSRPGPGCSRCSAAPRPSAR